MLATHPGYILATEFLEEINISQAELSRATKIPRSSINEIIKGKRAITADTAMRLSLYFGNSANFWLNLQVTYDLQTLKSEQIKKEVQPAA